jgi:hypothetical protein
LHKIYIRKLFSKALLLRDLLFLVENVSSNLINVYNLNKISQQKLFLFLHYLSLQIASYQHSLNSKNSCLLSRNNNNQITFHHDQMTSTSDLECHQPKKRVTFRETSFCERGTTTDAEEMTTEDQPNLNNAL